MTCPNCGYENNDNASFCQKCGYSFNKSNKYDKKKIAEQTKKEFDFIMDSATSRLNGWAGGKGAVKVNLFKFFGSVFKGHTKDEADEIFEAGTPKTTPSLNEVANDKVRPWLFSRILVYTLFLGTLLYQFANNNTYGALYSMAAVVASATPIAVLVLFFEVNVFKNISFYQVIKMAVLGGILAMLSTIKYDKLAVSVVSNSNGLDLMGSIISGFLPELAIVLVASRFVKTLNAKSILNGLLIGASVGAGFSIFESIVYVVGAYKDPGDTLQAALLRTTFSVANSTEWGAMAVAALVLVKGARDLNTSDFFNFTFLRFFVTGAILHALWNWNLFDDFTVIRYITISVFTWIVIFVLIHAGLQQVKRLQLSLEHNKEIE